MQRACPTPTSILRQIAQLRAQPAQEALARILDSLDAWGAAETARTLMPRLISWGPKAVSGLLPMTWVGVVVWQRAPGYSGYKLLTVRGIWALQEGTDARIIVGQKVLPYSASFYEAEAYHKLIRKGFDIYYSDTGAPPTTTRSYDALYSLEQRLEMREAVKAWRVAGAALDVYTQEPPPDHPLVGQPSSTRRTSPPAPKKRI